MKVNVFLFSPQGEQCLRALLQYQRVLNRTLYSDAFYDVHGKVDEYGRHERGDVTVHVELPTLWKNYKLSVGVARRGMGVVDGVKGLLRVVALDLVAADGVVHVLDEALVTPKRVGKEVKEEEELTVEALGKFGGCGEHEGTPRMEL